MDADTVGKLLVLLPAGIAVLVVLYRLSTTSGTARRLLLDALSSGLLLTSAVLALCFVSLDSRLVAIAGASALGTLGFLAGLIHHVARTSKSPTLHTLERIRSYVADDPPSFEREERAPRVKEHV